MIIGVDQLPEELARALFEALRLEIRYNRDTRTATCRVTLTGRPRRGSRDVRRPLPGGLRALRPRGARAARPVRLTAGSIVYIHHAPASH